ncbi:cell division protein FtsZ [Rhodovulum sp. DZ06]|uniref:cell division protein FtsZ n=1 Tax=Rhodovulum sp. DZ06 TaxID=3425126 RepID=UPI003D32F0A8
MSTLNLIVPEESSDLRPRITVFGVGGAGGNAVNNMIEKELEGVDFVVANTDAQALQQSQSERRIQLGVGVTQGLGAGAKPQVGGAAAEESIEEIVEQLHGAHMCFITAGMGGGTGTGAAPVIARAARELGVLTVGVVTKPFHFEGTKRMRFAEAGVAELQKVVDTLIIIPNQNLFRIANERTTFAEAFMLADDVLYQGVKGVTDLMVRPGLINLDFADVRSVMDEMGKAMMGTGEAEGEERAVQAAEKAIANPLLDEISLKGARGVLINITGGYDLTLFELDEAANRIRQEVDPEANIIVGSTLDPEIEGVMRVSVVATGIEADEAARPVPQPQRETQAVAAAPAAPAAAPAPAPEAEIAQRAAAEGAFVPPAPAAPEDVASEPETAAAPEPTPAPAPVETPAPAPVAAQAPQPAAGEPSAEVLARLQAAVSKQPEGGRAPLRADPRPAPKPAAAPAPAAERKPAAAPVSADADRGRFGINSLIHRMAGGAEARQPEPAPSAERMDENDRLRDVPAFLRRQAN